MRARAARGGVLIEGIVGTLLVLIVLLLCATLIINVVYLVTVRQKISIVANAAVT